MAQKRFKTKQELWVGNSSIHYHDEMPWGEPYVVGKYLPFLVRDTDLTTKPHPYEGKNLRIHVSNPNECGTVQKKAFALGYTWFGGVKDVRHTDKEILFLSGGMIIARTTDIGRSNFTTITPQQFMEGYLPEEMFESLTERSQQDSWTIDNLEIDKAKHTDWVANNPDFDEAKPDAYIKDEALYIVGDDGRSFELNRINIIGDHLWQYNLMSEEKFKAKHPDKIKFDGWNVTVEHGLIMIGCESFDKLEARRFMAYCQRIQKHKIDLKEFYVFLYKSKEKLGL